LTKQFLGVTIGGDSKLLVGRVSYKKDINSLVGTGVIKMPFSERHWAAVGSNVQVSASAGTGTRKKFFTGIAKYSYRKNMEISLEFEDNGRYFKQPFTGTYKSENLVRVLKNLIETSKHYPQLNLVDEGLLEREISRVSTSEYGQYETPDPDVVIGDTPTTVTGTFFPSCPKCSGEYDNQLYVSSVLNYCPKCKKHKVIIFDGEDYLCSPSREGCGAHFCGIDGYEKIGNAFFKLTLTYGPTPNVSRASSLKYSPSGTTYESELKEICKKNGLYLYITPEDKCVVSELSGIPSPDTVIPNHYVKADTLGYLKKLNTTVRGIDIESSVGVVSVTTPDVNPNLPRISLIRRDLSKEEARLYAKNMISSQLQENVEDPEITIPLDPGMVPGKWVNVETLSSPNKTFEVKMVSHKVKPGISVTNLRLNVQPRSINIYRPPVNLTYDQVIKTAARFDYNSAYKTSYEINEKKMGDTYAMSEWLHNNLSSKGYEVRIIEYDRPGLSFNRARAIQVKTNNTWDNLDYSEYGFNTRFWPPNGAYNIKVIK
jgi:hypothetical protein